MERMSSHFANKLNTRIASSRMTSKNSVLPFHTQQHLKGAQNVPIFFSKRAGRLKQLK
jgi:hypothetical protein